MLLRNDLLHYAQPSPRTIRILWIAPEQNHACVFDVAAASAEVERIAVHELLADLAAGRAQRLSSDPYLVVLGQERLPAKYQQVRARAWEIIQPLTAREPDIYDARLRGQLIAQATRTHGVSHPTVYRYLRRYWQRGQTPNALLPDYANSGGRGKVRTATEGVKRGRPRKDGSDPGLNADDEIRRVFRVATAHYAATQKDGSRRGVYASMIRDFFSGQAALPTFGQFNYWLDQDDDRPPSVARRHRATPGVTALHGTAAPPPAWTPPPGRPGTAFHLDVARAAIALAAGEGQPLLYVVLDRFSRMVTGLHVAAQGPSWQQALAALAHCGADKVDYCRQQGRAIDVGQWPCQHLPDLLYAPAELLEGGGGGALLNNFNLRCLPGDDAPDEWRTVLEKRVRLSAPAAPSTPGGRLDGVLNLAQFSRVVLEAVIYYNNHHRLPHAGGATPRQLWEWGVRHRGGALRACSEPLLRVALLA